MSVLIVLTSVMLPRAYVTAPGQTVVALAPPTFTFVIGVFGTAMFGITFQLWRLLNSSVSCVSCG